MKTLLITGGAGFIGSNFVDHLYTKYPDYRLLVLDTLTYAGNVENLPVDYRESGGRLEFWYGNVCNAAMVESLVERADMIVHFAAETHVTRSIYDNYQFFQTDVLGTQVIANAILKHRDTVERFIHISTSEVYGTAESVRMDEEHPLLPMSPYASAKAGADRLVYSYWCTYGLPAVIIRPFNQFGPKQHIEKVIPRFITNALSGEPLPVHGQGEAMRDFTFVADTCEGLDRILHCDINKIAGEAINLGAQSHLSVLEIAHAVLDAMGKPKSLIQCVGDRPGQVFRHTADCAKAEQLIDWDPPTSFADALQMTIDWYVANPARWQHQLWTRDTPAPQERPAQRRAA
ncbi:MAG: GDP-mannose 4,6-dehydratase [Pirellulales bacterium]|nr:GDP-mannose 4,6-dehydratase [Pirellulales bacterium]